MELSRTQIKNLADKYPLGNFINFRKVKEQGFMNYMYLIKTNQGTFILRISKNTKSRRDLLFEIELLNSLHNLPVPKYIKDKRGRYINQFEGHYYSIYEYLKGTMPAQLTPRLRQEIAFFLAQFHNQTKHFNTHQQRFAWYTFTNRRANKFEKCMLPKLRNYKDEIRYLKSMVLKNRLPNSLPRGPIHVDIRRENSLTVSDRLTGIVDFDNCQIGPYILDLAMAIIWICTRDNGLDYRMVHEFVCDYEKHRRLNKLETQNLFRAITYAYASQVFVNHYVYVKGLVTKEHFQFGRRTFLTALKNLSYEQFSKRVQA